MKNLSLIILTLLVSNVFISSVSASENSAAITQAGKTCTQYASNLEDYLDTVLPAYLDPKITDANKKAIESYRTLIRKTGNDKVIATIGKDKTTLPRFVAGLFNPKAITYLSFFIYNPFGYGNDGTSDNGFSTMEYIPQNIKEFVMENDDNIRTCSDLSSFEAKADWEQSDIDANTNALKRNIETMNTAIKKQKQEAKIIKNKKVTSTILKRNNLALWKLRILVEEYQKSQAKG